MFGKKSKAISKLGRTSSKKCDCGFKKRGVNHDTGRHHLGQKVSKY